MDKREADELRKLIDSCQGVRVTGYRRYESTDSYELDCVDNATGYPFTVRNREDWDERVREAEFWATHDPV